MPQHCEFKYCKSPQTHFLCCNIYIHTRENVFCPCESWIFLLLVNAMWTQVMIFVIASPTLCVETRTKMAAHPWPYRNPNPIAGIRTGRMKIYTPTWFTKLGNSYQFGSGRYIRSRYPPISLLDLGSVGYLTLFWVVLSPILGKAIEEWVASSTPRIHTINSIHLLSQKLSIELCTLWPSVKWSS